MRHGASRHDGAGGTILGATDLKWPRRYVCSMLLLSAAGARLPLDANYGHDGR